MKTNTFVLCCNQNMINMTLIPKCFVHHNWNLSVSKHWVIGAILLILWLTFVSIGDRSVMLPVKAKYSTMFLSEKRGLAWVFTHGQ